MSNYKLANEDAEWLQGYCNTMRGIMRDKAASRDERNEARSKLNTTIIDARRRGIHIR